MAGFTPPLVSPQVYLAVGGPAWGCNREEYLTPYPPVSLVLVVEAKVGRVLVGLYLEFLIGGDCE